jgi:perosamine synthetase
VSYEPGICPVTERLHEVELISTPICRPPATGADIDDLITAINKVIRFKDELPLD